jgi:hypothetical protein
LLIRVIEALIFIHEEVTVAIVVYLFRVYYVVLKEILSQILRSEAELRFNPALLPQNFHEILHDHFKVSDTDRFITCHGTSATAFPGQTGNSMFKFYRAGMFCTVTAERTTFRTLCSAVHRLRWSATVAAV